VGVCWGHMVPLKAADRAIVGQQVKHQHGYMILISSVIFTDGCFEDSGWLMLDSKLVKLQLSQSVYNEDKNRSNHKGAEYFRLCLCLAHASLFIVCVVFLALPPMYPWE
jgi:hypothetical protein